MAPQAKMDLDDAQFVATGKRYHLTCFLAQQAAEKGLKAFLYFSGAESVRGHSVAELCDDAARLDPAFTGLIEQAAPLDKYYVPTRYPNGLPGGLPSHAFVLEDARMALAMATAVLDFVGKRLEQG